ncbi:MAG: Uma2 family endonuclease [Cyanobacteria bacterium]|nr:Uma2 family endonuclease [Cyanobacteriota bacterium]
MISEKWPSLMTVEEYLQWEERSPVKHEYLDGQVFAMTGATRRHNLITGNLYSVLRQHVRGGPCKVYIADVKVRVEVTNSFYYPDIMVACDRFDAKSVYTTEPSLIIEVLSPSTAVIDKREKLVAYGKIESLRQYIIVHQRKKQVDIYQKQAGSKWMEVISYSSGGSFVIDSISNLQFAVVVDDVYEDLVYPEGDEPSPEVQEEPANYLDEEELTLLDW